MRKPIFTLSFVTSIALAISINVQANELSEFHVGKRTVQLSSKEFKECALWDRIARIKLVSKFSPPQSQGNIVSERKYPVQIGTIVGEGRFISYFSTYIDHVRDSVLDSPAKLDRGCVDCIEYFVSPRQFDSEGNVVAEGVKVFMVKKPDGKVADTLPNVQYLDRLSTLIDTFCQW